MSNVGPGSEDLNGELESQLTEQEVKDLLTAEEYHQYQENTNLLELLSDGQVQALIQEYGIQDRVETQSTENTTDSVESDTVFEDS